MLSMQYLQTIVTIFIAAEIIFRLSKDIYKTKQKQKSRQGLLKLNWVIPNLTDEIENKFYLKKYILFTYLLDNNLSIVLKWIHNPQTKFSIKATGSIIGVLVLSIILTGILRYLAIYSFQ
jgi:hypothetical protein